MIVREATAEDRIALQEAPAAARFSVNSFVVALHNGSLAAFLAWRRLVPGECEILHLETLPLFRRNGLARRLLRYVKTEEPGEIFLEVRASNEAARKLYHSEEFLEIGLRPQYYSDPSEDGIVLKFHS